MRNIVNISLFLLGSCKVGCKGCYASHPVRDRSRVLDNFHSAIDYVAESDLLTFSTNHEITINLETSGLLSSNKEFLLSSDFIRLLDIIDILRSRGMKVELGNADIITPRSYLMVETLEKLLRERGLILDLTCPSKSYWNGSETITVEDAVPQGGMGWISQHIKLDYTPIYTGQTPNTKYYVYNQYGCDLGSSEDNFESYNDRYRDNGIWNEYTYHLMIDDKAHYLCPLLHSQGKLLRSVKFELDDKSVQETIALIDTKYKEKI